MERILRKLQGRKSGPCKQGRQFGRRTSLVAFGEASGLVILCSWTQRSRLAVSTRVLVTLGFAPPMRACRSKGMAILGTLERLDIRWHPLAVAHTHADWIGHCTPSAQLLNRETASAAESYTYPIGYGLTRPRALHLGYRIVMYDTRKAICPSSSWRDSGISVNFGR